MILRQGFFRFLLCAFLQLRFPFFLINTLCLLFFLSSSPENFASSAYSRILFAPSMAKCFYFSFPSTTSRSSQMLSRHFTTAVWYSAMAKLVGHGWSKWVLSAVLFCCFLFSIFLNNMLAFVPAMIYDTFHPPKKNRGDKGTDSPRNSFHLTAHSLRQLFYLSVSLLSSRYFQLLFF